MVLGITFPLNIHILTWIFFLSFSFFLFWLCWVFIAGRGLSLVAPSGGYSLLRCAGFSFAVASLIEVASLVAEHGL